MPQLTRDSILLVKVESANGVDIVPAAADALLVESAEPSVDIGYGERPTLNGNYVDSLPVRTHQKASVAISVRLRGSGTAATATGWACLLQAAGFKVTATTEVAMTPDIAEAKTVSAYLYRGGALHKFIGAAFSDASLTYDGGWKLTGTLTGKYSATLASALVASPVYDTGSFLSGLAPTFTYKARAAILRSLTINLGAEIAERGNINDATGVASFYATSHKPAGTMVIEDEAIGTYDWRALAIAQEPAAVEALTFTVGTVAGSIFEITMPNCRLGSWTEGNDAGIATLEFPLSAADSAASTHDWITITTK